MKAKARFVDTIWEVWTYDVWGNPNEGFTVNDRSCLNRNYPMRIRLTTNNPGSKREFLNAYPTDKQLRKALHLKRIMLELDGDDVSIYVNHASSGYPCGELLCVSHSSLCPPRAKTEGEQK